MTAEVTKLKNPIDVMYLIHKPLRAEAARVKEIVKQLEEGSTLQPFRLAFYQWVMALEYHSIMEEAVNLDLMAAAAQLIAAAEGVIGGRRVSLVVEVMKQGNESPVVLVLSVRAGVSAYGRFHGESVLAEAVALRPFGEQRPRVISRRCHDLTPCAWRSSSSARSTTEVAFIVKSY